jgi:homoserine O-succinyltransferase
LATERQFTRLLRPRTRRLDIQLRFFYLPEIARGEAAHTRLLAHYEPIAALRGAEVDGLIVTGCEPLRSDLRNECYWPSLVRLIDWAKENTISTIWSCLAAHAAVLHLDGIERERLPVKVAGVYEFRLMCEHPLLHGIGGSVQIPHSRLNTVVSDDLVRSGYKLLTHSDHSGVDAFLKQYDSLFLFLQGHPEYGAGSLYREYRRDMARFLAGEQPNRPATPENYFSRDAHRAINSFASTAREGASLELMKSFPDLRLRPRNWNEWRAFGDQLFGNWLQYVAEMKMARGISL